MLIRSGKIQFLFWTACFSVLLYIWLVATGVQTFIVPEEKPMQLPESEVALMFVLYGLLVVAVLAGTIVSIMINNKFYRNFFGAMLVALLALVLAAKAIFG